MDSKLPLDIFENVMQLATEGCKAIAKELREVSITRLVLQPIDLNNALKNLLFYSFYCFVWVLWWLCVADSTG